MPRLHKVFDAVFIIAIIVVGIYLYQLYSTGNLYPERIQAILIRVLPYLIPFFIGMGLASLIVKRMTPPEKS
ncbi:MAG: hypothetical protein ACE5Z5_04400 [Candidatus Bathyarchaeia archaeon]